MILVELVSGDIFNFSEVKRIYIDCYCRDNEINYYRSRIEDKSGHIHEFLDFTTVFYIFEETNKEKGVIFNEEHAKELHKLAIAMISVNTSSIVEYKEIERIIWKALIILEEQKHEKN